MLVMEITRSVKIPQLPTFKILSFRPIRVFIFQMFSNVILKELSQNSSPLTCSCIVHFVRTCLSGKLTFFERQYNYVIIGFSIFRGHHEFLLLCLKVLCMHLSLALNNNGGSNLVGKQAKPLRNLLFKLIDTETPDSIQQVRFYHLVLSHWEALAVSILP